MQETWVQSLGWQDPLEKEVAAHASSLDWEVLWTEEPGGLQSQRVGHDLVTRTHTQTNTHVYICLSIYVYEVCATFEDLCPGGESGARESIFIQLSVVHQIALVILSSCK